MYNQKHILKSSKEIDNKDPEFKIGAIVRITKYKNTFGKGYVPNWSEEVFVIIKVKNTVPWTSVINDLIREEIVEVGKKHIKKSLEFKESSREKVMNYMLNGKDTIICLIAGQIKKTQYK